MYIYLSSKTSAQYPENTASDFTIQLPTNISGVKECGAVEVKLPVVPKTPLFICTDLCVESITNSKTLPVLRRLAQKTLLPSFITYIPLRAQSFDTIRVYICKESGEATTFAGETRVTLHLR